MAKVKDKPESGFFYTRSSVSTNGLQIASNNVELLKKRFSASSSKSAFLSGATLTASQPASEGGAAATAVAEGKAANLATPSAGASFDAKQRRATKQKRLQPVSNERDEVWI